MPLMGSLYVGASGLQTSQNALNTTAHNLSNIETTGYTRQQVQLAGRTYLTISVDPKAIANKQTGLGVIFSEVKQVRDDFLDRTYRRESGRSMFYQVTTETLQETESLLGELNGEAFQNTMTDFWTAIQELVKDPSNSVTQGMLVQRAEEFVLRAEDVYDSLCSYQDNMNMQIKQKVDLINDYGKQLLDLNEKICGIEAGKVEKANDYRDTRNAILDELAQLVDISYKEDSYGVVSVRIQGEDFVRNGVLYEIGMQKDKTTGFYTPFWPQNTEFSLLPDGTKEYNIKDAKVFDLEREISADMETDIGGLKAMMLARGDHRADYSDIASGNYDKVSQSVIMNLEAEFDQMIHNIVKEMNQIFATTAGVVKGDLTLQDGTVLQGVSYCESDTEAYMRKSDGSPIQLFGKISTVSYDKVTGADGKEYWVYRDEDLENPDTLYTLKNLQIDQELKANPGMLGFILEDHSVDMKTAEALKDAFTAEKYELNPTLQRKTTFIDYYADLISQVANWGYVFGNIYENQVGTVEATESARQQVIGVSSDEELTNMIKFQNAYNASSRYINVVDEMLEHILNTLGT